MPKKVISIVLALTIVISLFTIIPIHGSAATEYEAVGASGGSIGNCRWSYDDGTLTISGDGSMYEYYWNGWEKTIKDSVTTVIIEEGVTDIRARAFRKFNNLTEITIPKSVKQIGEDAFDYCDNLKNVFIADIDAWCKIKFITPDPEYDGTSPLIYANNLYCNNIPVTDVEIPDGVTEIAAFQFSFSSLESITIPDSVTSIGDYAFTRCYNLQEVEFSNSVATLGEGVFQNCANLEKISLPNSINSTGKYTFRYCYKLKSATLSNSMPRIEEDTFAFCDSLVSVTIPNSVSTIGKSAFFSCNNLREVIFGSGVTSIEDSAFAESESLSSIIIPDSVEYIGIHVFGCCKNLLSVALGNHVKSIGKQQFFECYNLREITIPDSVQTIGEKAFFECESLTTVRIGSGVRSIGKLAFDLCPKITNFYVTDTNSSFTSVDGNLYSKNQQSFIKYAAGKTEESFRVPDSVKYIERDAFRRCNLINLELPNNVSSIGEDAFWECKNLLSLTLPNSLTVIEKEVFYNCSNLKSVSFSNRITEIKSYAFYGCSNLRDVYFGGKFDKWNEIVIGTSNDNLLSANIHFIDSTKGVLRCKSQTVPEITIEFNDQWFADDSKDYNHNIAQMCSLVDLAGYQDESDLKSTLESLSFIVDNNYLNLHTGREDNGRDKVNYFIASKDIILSDGTNKLIFVGCIGSDDAQWNSDFDPDGKGSNTNYSDSQSLHRINHRGFNDAKNFVFEKLAEYFKRNAFDSDRTKLLITGHSRGAATANLISAELINGRKIDGQHTVKSENLFTYTYATPNNTTDQNRYDPKYDRIINIVNPTDFITKTMPSAWGWGRYGKTYTLPSKTNDNNYDNLKASMLDYYTILNYATSGETKFHDYPLGEFEVFSVVTTMTNSIWGLDSFYNIPHSLYGLMPMTPYSFFQNGLCPIVGGEGNKALAYTIVGSSLSPGKNNKLYRSITEYFLADQLNFEDAHKMVTYCAYMMGLSSSELLSYREGYLGSVNCPVDVEIYDMMTNELVGQITNNTVNEEIAAKANSVVMTVDGDEKQFWLPSNGYYDVKLIGNDTGTMDYSVKTINSDLGEISRSNYDNIPLEPNKTYTHNYDSYSIGSDYDRLTDEDWNDITANESFSAGEKQTYSVTIDVEGSGVATDSITVTSGDYVNVVAEPVGSYFLGWYNGDNLISQDIQYRFRPNQDTEITAKFSGLIGDTNLDGTIDILDVTAIQCYLAELETISDEQIALADTNGDGEIDIADATHLQMYLAEFDDIVLGKQPTV